MIYVHSLYLTLPEVLCPVCSQVDVWWLAWWTRLQHVIGAGDHSLCPVVDLEFMIFPDLKLKGTVHPNMRNIYSFTLHVTCPTRLLWCEILAVKMSAFSTI